MNGVTYWRQYVPLNAMIGQDMAEVQNTNKFAMNFAPGVLGDTEMIIFNRFLADYSHRDFFDCCERDGVKVVVDLDDWYFLPPHHINYQHYKPRVPIIRENLKRADLVTVSTEYLKQAVKKDIGVESVVLPNSVDFTEPQFRINRTESNKVRFGWCGGATHGKDLEIIAEDLATLHTMSEAKGRYQLVLHGYVDNDVFWRKAAGIFSFGNRADAGALSVIHAANVFTYAQGYNRFDVALAPLIDDEFNRCKSELKCIEAGAFGLPIIASDVVPYQLAKEKLGDGVILVRNKRGAFLKEMKRLINNPDEVKERGRIAHEAVKKHFNVHTNNELRLNSYIKCLQSTGVTV